MSERRKMDFKETTKITIPVIMLIAFLVFALNFVAGVQEWKTETDLALLQIQRDYLEFRGFQIRVVDQLSEQDVLFKEIQTDLKWIILRLEEMKKGN